MESVEVESVITVRMNSNASARKREEFFDYDEVIIRKL